MRRLSFVLGILFAALIATAPAATAQDKAEKPKPAASASTPLNLNTATAAQLETLPGIGTRTAQLIVEHRQKNGNFKKVEEIIEKPSSCPCLLRNCHFGGHRSVSRSR